MVAHSHFRTMSLQEAQEQENHFHLFHLFQKSFNRVVKQRICFIFLQRIKLRENTICRTEKRKRKEQYFCSSYLNHLPNASRAKDNVLF